MKKHNKIKSEYLKIFKWGDIILALILIVAVVLTFIYAFKDDASEAQVYIDGELEYTLDLSKDQELQILDGAMTIVVSNGEVYVKESNCSEQLCVDSTPIRKDGGMIICLPNKVVIKVTNEEVDAIS